MSEMIPHSAGGPVTTSEAERVYPATQADREGAAEIGRRFCQWTPRQVEITLEGRGDTAPIIQIIARIRHEG